MATPYKPLIVRPRDGGKLVTDTSSDEAGLANYRQKLNFRRELDQEVRIEGHDYFWPNVTGAFASNPQNQPFANNVTARSITSLTRSGTTATATVAGGHDFVVGETIRISGATPSGYNSTFLVSAVTRTTFAFVVTGSPTTPASGSPVVQSAEPFNLVHLARRPNGKTAVIVGTKTRLFRFFALENGAYFEGNGTADAYFDETQPDPDNPYFDDNPGDWQQIGSGFSPNGNRWEAANINGYAIFNNGVDLPVTYRLEDAAVEPIHELRENGIASVGTIADYNGVLLCGDTSQIREGKLEELFRLIGVTDAGDMLASQTGTTVTTPDDFFSAASVGAWIVFDSGETKQITGYTGPRTVTVGDAATITLKRFKLRVKAAQTGSVFSASITGDLDHTTMEVTTSGAITVTPGQRVQFTNGFESVVAAVTDLTHFTLTAADDPGEDYTGLPLWLIDDPADYTVTAESSIFTDEMVGRALYWDNGDVRTITEYLSGTQVKVDNHLPVSGDFIGIENPASYGRFTDSQFIDRIQYQVINSMNDEPRRWASGVPGSITAGSNILTLAYPAKSFEAGQEVLVFGAGLNGGNLLAKILYVAANRIIVLDTLAVTSVTEADVQQADAVGSIVGSYDLEEDGSGILKMLTLASYLIVYKDTSIFIGTYTGDSVAAPFQFRFRDTPSSHALHYRHTLALVNDNQAEYHIYAGRDAFYRFDLASLRPQEIDLFGLCEQTFFEHAKLTRTNDIFAADNAVAKHLCFVCPTEEGVSRVLAYDYRYATLHHWDAQFTAAATVKRPETGESKGVTEDWFVMATATGVILLYGKTTEPVAAWSGAQAIWYRRHANPYSATKTGYESVLEAGMSDFGAPHNEKQINNYVLFLASQSLNAPILVEFLGVRNVSEADQTDTVLGRMVIERPVAENAVPVYFVENYLADRLTVEGFDNPVRVSKRLYEVAGLNTRSVSRVPSL